MSRKKKHHHFGVHEPDILPLMNIMLMLVSAVISMTSHVPLGMISTEAQKLSTGAGPASATPPKQELAFAVFITENGFDFSKFGKIYKGEAPGKALIPKIQSPAGELVYDFEKLREEAFKVKQEYKDETNVMITAAQTIEYGTVIRTMDALRNKKIDEKAIIMFPAVAFSPGIVSP